MAKILWFDIPAVGHILPTLTIVSEPSRRGHEIVYYSTDDTMGTIETSGARLAGYPPDVLSMREIADATTRLVHPVALMLRKCHQLVPVAQGELAMAYPRS